MGRICGYVRLSATRDPPEGGLAAMLAAGFEIAPHDYVEEVAASTTSTRQRRLFLSLLDRLGAGDALVTLQVDALGRSVADVSDTLNALASARVDVFCLEIGDVSLTGPEGQATRRVVDTLAAFDRRLVRERLADGAPRVRSSREATGRPQVLTLDQQLEVMRRRMVGASLAELAVAFGVSRSAIQRVQRRLSSSGDLASDAD